jgi:hypothetical protein
VAITYVTERVIKLVPVDLYQYLTQKFPSLTTASSHIRACDNSVLNCLVFFCFFAKYAEVRDSIVVKVLRYKAESRRFETR